MTFASKPGRPAAVTLAVTLVILASLPLAPATAASSQSAHAKLQQHIQPAGMVQRSRHKTTRPASPAVRGGDDEKTEVLLAKAVFKIMNNDTKAAQLLLLELLKEHPKHPEALFYMGECKIEDRDTDAAIKYLLEANKYAPDWVEPPLTLARIYMSRNQPEKAIEAATLAVKADKSSPEAYLLRGSLYYAQDDFKEGMTDFKKCVDVALKDGAYIHSAIEFLESTCVDVPRAVELSEYWASVAPGSLDARFTLAGLYEAQNRKSDALKQYEAAAEIAQKTGDKESAELIQLLIAGLKTEAGPRASAR